MHWAKLSLCLILSAWILFVLRGMGSRSGTRRALLTGIMAGLVLRVLGALAIYMFVPWLNFSSDPVRAYIVQARNVLAGMVPYRDFASSYSFLFSPALAVPVWLWNSVGSIAISMTAAEIVAMWFYMRRNCEAPTTSDLLTVFCWVWIPSHFYWLSIAGYNSGMILAGIMVSVVLAHQGKDIAAGIMSAVTFGITKLLALLFWPAVVFKDFDRTRVMRRTVPHVAFLAVLGMLAFIGADPTVPAKLEFGKYTSGTIWFFWWMLGEPFRASPVYRYGPVVLFFTAFVFLFLKYSRSVKAAGSTFDASATFIGGTGLLFMLLSRKAYTFYLPMFLPFLLHVIFSERARLARIIPVIYLGSITTIEPYLWMQVRGGECIWGNPRLWALAVLDLGIVISYGVLLRLCWRKFDGVDLRAATERVGAPV